MTRCKFVESEQIGFLSNLDISTWPMVNIDNLSPTDREKFLKRRTAVEMYLLNRTSLSEIKSATGIVDVEVRRFVKRCLELDQDGNVWGYRALIPQKRIQKYSRKNLISSDKTDATTTNFTGAFTQLLYSYPSIQETIENLYFKRKKGTIYEPKIQIKHLHKHFLEACRQAGLKLTNYPFNTTTLARRSLERYIKKLETIYFAEAARLNGDEAGRIASSTGIGDQNNPLIIRPFERVQFDGHLIDAMFSVTFYTPEGDEITKVIDRIWLLTIIDVATRAVIGYQISLNKEYNAFDVLRCIQNSIMPWKPRELTIPGLKYNGEGGLPSGRLAQAEWGLWSELYYDNGKANLAAVVKEKLSIIVGCNINAGPVKTPERRGLLERFFGLLEENGYHRLPSTTGSNPKDPRRKNPEQSAIKYKISFDHLLELTDVLIANYNGTPHSGVNYLTPLEAIEQRVNRGMTIRQLPDERKSDLSILSIQVEREVKGNVKSGRRPYIQFENVVYRSDVLAKSPGLIGTKLTLVINVEDLRFVQAFMPDGSEFGLLCASGKWGITPHSLEVRRQINRLKHRKQLFLTSEDDPIEAYKKFLEKQSIDKKSFRKQLLQLNCMTPNEVDSKQETIDSGKMEPNETVKVKSVVVNLKPKTHKRISKNRKTIIY